MSSPPVPMAISDLGLRDRALMVNDSLVLSDLHLGHGTMSTLDFPVGNGTRTVDRIRNLITWADPAEIILAGDVLHSFPTVPQTVNDALASIIDAAETAGASIVAIEGNHDTMLSSVWDHEIHQTYRIGKTVVCHGHECPNEPADRYLIGHEHPVLDAAGRRQPCYLAGDGVADGSDVVVLPAFNQMLRGVSITRLEKDGFMSPLVINTDAFAPILWDTAASEPVMLPQLGEVRQRP